MAEPPRRVEEPGMGALDVWPIEPEEETLLALLRFLFEEHWRAIRFGPLIEGAAYEIRAPARPRLAMLDGYLTIDFGDWHLHLCIGPHAGSRARPTPPDLARIRRTARAELYRQIGPDGAPSSWGVRLFNGAGEQQITVFLPNPFLTDEDRFAETPDWSRLALWDALRRRFLGLGPDALDRTGTRFPPH